MPIENKSRKLKLQQNNIAVASRINWLSFHNSSTLNMELQTEKLYFSLVT